MATILVVDDEKPVRQFLVAAFEQEGHHVLEAHHGRHALHVLASSSLHPDLVLSDIMMPVVGGLELCSILKADPSTAHIPVVLMSAAHSRASEASEASGPSTASAASGASTVSRADAIIAKPFDLDTLDALIERLLLNRPAQDR
ncbi:MAG: response regulator [Chloroflexi bacterium]|nr:response regulator [Chloroflexota bacterium]MBV9547327.1 response regulator [Chloroflexota bacterium]